MALKKNGPHRSHYTGGRKGDTAELSARLAPVEEREAVAAGRSANNGGAIVVDTGRLKLPEGFTGEAKETRALFRPEPVVVAILIIALAFIAFITYLISIEPVR